MKIVHVVSALKKGGGEKCVAELANHASHAGHQITIIAGWPVSPELLRDTLLPKVHVIFVSKKSGSRIGRYLSLTLWLWKHRKFLDKQDIIHCHLSYGIMFGFLVKLRRSVTGKSAPVIIQTNHSVGAPVSYLRRWSQFYFARQCDALILIANDKYWNKFARKNPKIRTKIIYNGISQSNFPKINASERYVFRRKLGIPDHCKLIVGAIGRMTPDREPWNYLPIFREITKEFGQDVHFLLAGGGSELNRMQSLAIEYGLDGQIHFPGEVNKPNMSLSVMDLYISINVEGITGLAGMEAAMSGLPVIAIQWTKGYNAVKEDWIWSSTNQLEVAKRSCELLHSKIERKLLGRKQKSYVQKYHTVEAMALAYYDMYRATIKSFQSLDKNVDRELV